MVAASAAGMQGFLMKKRQLLKLSTFWVFSNDYFKYLVAQGVKLNSS